MDNPDDTRADKYLIDQPSIESHHLPQVEISQEDMEFMDRVFNQVRDVDFKTPPPPPQNLVGPDKKMNDLREQIRRLERDLARVGLVWRGKQAQIASLDQILAQKEQERLQALNQCKHIQQDMQQQQDRHQEQMAAQQSLLSTIHQQKKALEEQLQAQKIAHQQSNVDYEQRISEIIAEKNNLMKQFRQDLETAQDAFNRLREQSTQSIGTLEKQLQISQEKIQHIENELHNKTLALSALEIKISLLGDKLTEREKTTAMLAEQLTQTRRDAEQRVLYMQQAARASEDETAQTLAKLGALQKSRQQT